jgi:hypothetical protein
MGDDWRGTPSSCRRTDFTLPEIEGDWGTGTDRASASLTNGTNSNCAQQRRCHFHSIAPSVVCR